MTRLRADLLLLLASIIWGTAFVSQKQAFAHVGAFTFVASRFFLSALLVVIPAFREFRRLTVVEKSRVNKYEVVGLCVAITIGAILQQVGLANTSVTNAGFLTGLYVLFVPMFCALIYHEKLSRLLWAAALLSVAGVWLLSGAQWDGFTSGDWLVMLCAVAFAFQVALIGRIMMRVSVPFTLSFLQYASIASVATIGMFLFEQPAWADIHAAMWPILYAGIVSGGIAYTLQVIAQQYAPPSDSAIILGSEAVFAAIAAAILIDERLNAIQYGGCALIIFAILLVEFMPMLKRRRN